MSRQPIFAMLLTMLSAGFSLADDKATVRIGIPRSIFRDIPPALLTFANQPFKDLMKSQTGIEGEVVNDTNALNIAKDLDSGKTQLGVFLGHEFAWAKQKYPQLEAMVIAVPKPREIQAFILVRFDCEAKTLADMKDKNFVMSSGTRDHARLFLEKKRAEEMGNSTYTTMPETATIHDAIHKVNEGEADFTVVDQASWSYFQKLYPGPSQNLRVLAKSDIFPNTVIAYKKGSLTDVTVKKLRDGLLSAHQNPKGSRLMGTIKMEKFDTLPANYSNSLNEVIKIYPAPSIDRANAVK